MGEVKFTGYDSVFAERLRGLMTENGTTQKELAGVTGITRQAISQYMDGSIQPNIEKLYKIADYFKVSADYFLGLSDVKSFDLDTKAISEKTGLSGEAIEGIKTLSERLPDIHDLSIPSGKDFLAIDVLNSMIGNDDLSFFALIHDIWLYSIYGVSFEALKEWGFSRFQQQKNIYYNEQEKEYYKNGKQLEFLEVSAGYEFYLRMGLRSIFGESMDREYEMYKLSRSFEKICEKTSKTLTEKILASEIFQRNFESHKEQYKKFEKDNPAEFMELPTLI